MQDPQFFQKFSQSFSLLVIYDQSQGSPNRVYDLVRIQYDLQYSPISIHLKNGQNWDHK